MPGTTSKKAATTCPARRAWTPFEPTDGIFDEARESFSLDLSSLSLKDPTLLTVRVFDMAGNSEVAHVRTAP